MKKSDLYREWARVLDMCEGPSVKPIKCWKFEGYLQNESPDFEYDKPELFEFAVAILEDKPVFVGDNVYSKRTGEKLDWDDPDHLMQITGDSLQTDPEDLWCWNPPNKTFMLNGEELPCPVKIDGEVKHSFKLGSRTISFDTFADCAKVFNAINKLLKGSTQ